MPKTVKGADFEIFLTSILSHCRKIERDPFEFNIRSVAKISKNEGRTLWGL